MALKPALNLLGVFIAGMAMAVFLIPLVAHGPTVAGIVKVVFTAFYALWISSDLIRRLK